ncbi:MAG TPA: ribonuclease HI family protein [Candidatus Omnitrophota bacterium]|nr:ribonuclease HI family protein [Candidatus Omnitrophota bacterium]
MKSKKVFIYIDGGARGNPGPAGIGVVMLDSGKKKLKEIYKYIGEATNNIAEYSALVCALEEAASFGAEDIVLHMDSELVAKQLSGEYRVKNEDIKTLFDKALGLLKIFNSFEVKRIDRSKNKEADKLVNKAINLASLF